MFLDLDALELRERGLGDRVQRFAGRVGDQMNMMRAVHNPLPSAHDARAYAGLLYTTGG